MLETLYCTYEVLYETNFYGKFEFEHIRPSQFTKNQYFPNHISICFSIMSKEIEADIGFRWFGHNIHLGILQTILKRRTFCKTFRRFVILENSSHDQNLLAMSHCQWRANRKLFTRLNAFLDIHIHTLPRKSQRTRSPQYYRLCNLSFVRNLHLN